MLWVYVAWAFALSAAWLAQSRILKWVFAVSGVFLLIVLPAELWTEAQFDRAGCDGNILKGLHCPDPSFLTKVAIWHGLAGFLGLLYSVFILPFLLMLAFLVEIVVRLRT